MTDRKTISIYDQRAGEYASKLTSDAPYPRLEAFINAMPDGGHVLDLGCGPGNAAARMKTRGLRVDALDASAAMVDLARDRYGIDVRLGTFDDVCEIEAYDGIWAHFSILHAPRDSVPALLHRLNRALKPSGRLLLAMKSGIGEKRDSIGRHYCYFSEAELDDMLSAAGFTVVDKEHGRDRGLAGTPEDWIIHHATA